jgi:hypothetical protein
MGHPSQNWNDTWIKENIGKYESTSEMCKAYQKETGHNCVPHSFRTHIQRKFNHFSGLTWTEEELNWVTENFPRLGGLKCAPEFEKRFGKKRSHTAIMTFAHRHGIFVDEDAIEANKNYSRRVPIGTIVDDGDGYLKIKVGPEYSSSGWVRYHRYLYEQKHGKIPRGYKIMFLDGDKRNYSDENMVAIPASYFALMNKLNLHSEFPEINFAGIQWCDLYSALRKKGYRLSRGEFIKEF